MPNLSDELFVAIDDYVRRAVAPLLERITTQEETIRKLEESLKANVAAAILSGIVDVDGDLVLTMSDGSTQRPGHVKGADGRDGADGKSVDPKEVAAAIKEQVAAAVAALPPPKAGRDGADGKSVDPKEVAALVKEQVAAAVAAIPKPKDGDEGPPGNDGMSAVEIARAHGFVGSDADWLASLRGKDGEDGEPGRDAVAIRPLAMIDEERSYPMGTFAHHRGGSWYAERTTDRLGDRPPQDCGWIPLAIGEQKCDIELKNDGRIAVIKRTTSTGITFERRFSLPVVIDRGIYNSSQMYWQGDAVTWQGSIFIARVDIPQGMPGKSDDWRLAVKRGRDGRDGKDARQ